MKNTLAQAVTESQMNSSIRCRSNVRHLKSSAFGVRRFSSECLEKLGLLKSKVAANLASEFEGLIGSETLRQVVNEADALAAMTPFPALFLPTLAEEKARAASIWQARQQSILNHTTTLAA